MASLVSWIHAQWAGAGADSLHPDLLGALSALHSKVQGAGTDSLHPDLLGALSALHSKVQGAGADSLHPAPCCTLLLYSKNKPMCPNWLSVTDKLTN